MDLQKPEVVGFSSTRLARIQPAMSASILMTQFIPNDTYPLTAAFRTLIYQVRTD